MRLIFIVLLVLAIYFVPKFVASQTDGFAIWKIRSDLPYNPKWETSPPTCDLKALLSQPFHYLNSGGQCYVFLSQDGKTVVKFFKHHLRRLPWLTEHFPMPAKYAQLREKQRSKRDRKLLRDFNSYKLAYEKLREESGLLFVHLNKTKGLNLKLTIVDKLKISHELDLDQYEFIVQKRAELALDHLSELIQKSKIEEAQAAIDSIIKLIVHRCTLGIYDEDPRLHRNLGFVDGHAILIDVGRLRPDQARSSPDVYRNDAQKIMGKLDDWLLENSPDLSHYLEEKLHEI